MRIKRYAVAAVTAAVLGTVTLATGISSLAATGWVQNLSDLRQDLSYTISRPV